MQWLPEYVEKHIPIYRLENQMPHQMTSKCTLPALTEAPTWAQPGLSLGINPHLIPSQGMSCNLGLTNCQSCSLTSLNSLWPVGIVLTCLKATTMELSLKQRTVSNLNDYCWFALTPVIDTCFESLNLAYNPSHCNNNIKLWYATSVCILSRRSGEDDIRPAWHTTLENLEKLNRHTRMLFLGFSTDFNTVVPGKVVSAPHNLSQPNCLLTNQGLSLKASPECQVGQTCILYPHSGHWGSQEVQRIYSLKFHDLHIRLLENFSWSSVVSVLPCSITAWYRSF